MVDDLSWLPDPDDLPQLPVAWLDHHKPGDDQNRRLSRRSEQRLIRAPTLVNDLLKQH
jgi:hypothetical protein